MALTVYNVKKWYKMFVGKSILHVTQNCGKYFSTNEIKGYYNDLSEKVIRDPELLKSDKLPTMTTPQGDVITFSVAIFQYGLGAYDLYISTRDQQYYKKFMQAVDWTFQNQEENGAWSTFGWLYPNAPYGAMAQGEALSLLVRAYKETLDNKYLQSSHRAIKFLLTPIENGGCTQYKGDDIILLEYTHKPPVLNGWIFAWWGIFDYVQITKDEEISKTLEASLRSLIKYLPKFNISYWSLYDLEGNIASPFYHNLHIAQLQAMFAITHSEIFKQYEELWHERQLSKLCKIIALLKKGWQKIVE